MVPLYTDPVRVARINDEIPQYRESKRANIACKKAIENLLAERFDGMRLHGGCAKELCEVLSKCICLSETNGHCSSTAAMAR